MNKDQKQQFDELLDLYLGKEATEQNEEKLMKLLDEVADEHMPEGMEQRLESFIQDLDDDEEEAPVVQLQPKAKQEYSVVSYFRRYAIAACMVLVVGLGIALHQWGSGSEFTDTCSSPAEAEAQMMRALTMFNTRTQQGLDEARVQIENPVKQTDYSRFISFE